MSGGFSDLGFGRVLVALGLVLVAAGMLWPVLSGSGLGRLPGDVAVERDGFRFYFPITTMILLSLLLSGALWLVRSLSR